MQLERGELLMVPAYLVKQLKQHCYHLEQYGVDLILGRNGFIWVGEHAAVDETAKLMGAETENFTTLETRNHICRLANAIRVLSALEFTLIAKLIIETAEASLSSNVAVDDMVGAEFFAQTAEREAARRVDLVRKGKWVNIK
jgi:exosome complex component RRP4